MDSYNGGPIFRRLFFGGGGAPLCFGQKNSNEWRACFSAPLFFLAPFFFWAPFCFSTGKKEKSDGYVEQDPNP